MNNVLHNRQFQQAVQIHQKIVDITSQSPPAKPIAVNSQDSLNDVFSFVQNSPDPYANELANLLRNPHVMVSNIYLFCNIFIDRFWLWYKVKL